MAPASVAQPGPARRDLPRIGILYSASRGTPSIEAVVLGLRRLGYRDGETVLLDFAVAGGRAESLPRLAQGLVDRKARVIVGVSGDAVLAANRVTRDIPIVSAISGGDLVAMGLVKSLGHPGGNVTGMNLATASAIRKRLESLLIIMPSLIDLAVLVHTANPENPELLKVLRASAAARGVGLRVVPIDGDADLVPAFLKVQNTGAQALMTLQGPFFFARRQRIADLAHEQHMPLAMGEPMSAEAGALLQVNPDIPGCAERSARFVDLILKGASPGDLPIETFDRTEVAVNLAAARALGLAIDASRLPDARVVEAASLMEAH